MSPEDIATIRHRRGFNIPWPVIASELGRTIQECRSAIGLPEYHRLNAKACRGIESRDPCSTNKQRLPLRTVRRLNSFPKNHLRTS